MGYIGIMENEMETTTMGCMGCWVLGLGLKGFILGSWKTKWKLL